MNPITTIIIPIFAQPHFLAQCLLGLMQNSRFDHRIIIVDTDRSARTNDIDAQNIADFLVHPITREKYRKYDTVAEFITCKQSWLKNYPIEYYNITDKYIEFRKEYDTSKFGYNKFEGGTDIAFKNNWALPLVTTEFVIPNWDADFFPSPGWDERLLATVNTFNGARYVWLPTHIQPQYFAILPQWKDYWEEGRAIACSRITLPTNAEENKENYHIIIDRGEFDEFVERLTKPDYIIEASGVRHRTHYLPTMYRTEELRNIIGPYSLKGSGYDIEIDERCGRLGFTKISPCDSFIMHKGHLPLELP